ncbi:glycosyltransferase family 2 protein [uncultured Cohaesibacter sp.]|uniref:glycosyltransferase family 2 protein n=1 Tax=uncultured Cohaesibacter sp. TaxID=1002546 RepID=UPI0029C9338B|nr:glycosyltransferase family 2 protein [uncultured Cohaesibacter sp.]
MKPSELIDKTKIFIAACFWYGIGMRVRAKNRFRILFGPASAILYQNAQAARAICADLANVTDADREAMKAEIAGWDHQPLISIVMPAYNTPAEFLEEAIASVQNQIYQNWELCIADDASPEPQVRDVLSRAEQGDPRIKVVYRAVNGHISEATNSALALATGDHVALMDHDDTLSEHALFHVAREIMTHPDVDLIYSDEDKIRGDGVLDGPHFKPDWNEELLLAQNYINHLSVFRRSVLLEIGGLRKGFEGSQDHDLLLRYLLRTGTDRVRHIPRILYHWRAYHGSGSFSDRALSQAIEARQRAVREYLAAKYPDRQTSVVHGAHDCNRIVWEIPSPLPKVSIIIPTRDHLSLVQQCVSSIFDKTAYPDYEVIIVDNNSEEAATLAYLESVREKFGVTVLRYCEAFNYAAINNFAVEQACGDVVVLLNNDTEVITPGWLRELVSYAIQPQIGCVGGRLLYKNRSVQHAGVILGVGGIANHAFHGYPARHTGYNARLQLPHYVSAVTGACLAIEKAKFLALGGMDAELFKVAYNDVDLCLMATRQGWFNVYTPHAELFHYESQSRGRDVSPEKQKRLQRESDNLIEKWGNALQKDPYYNENFSSDDGCFQFRKP